MSIAVRRMIKKNIIPTIKPIMFVVTKMINAMTCWVHIILLCVT